jgi:hypothetical protein
VPPTPLSSRESLQNHETSEAPQDSTVEVEAADEEAPAAISVVIYTQPKDKEEASPPSRSRRSSSRIPRTTEPKKAGRKKSIAEPASIPEPQVGGEDDCQTCKVHYSEDDGRNGAWIGCDGCKGWHHARCVGLDQATVDKIDKFYCISCEPTHGKSTCEYPILCHCFHAPNIL